MVFFVLASAGAQAARPEPSVYRFGSAPAWVKPATPDYAAQSAPGEISNGTWYLMLDRQIRLGAQGDDDYRHIALKVVNASGVEAQSQLDFGVDPSFQSLTLHALKLVRDGTVIDQRTRARITALPEEAELEQHVYNGGYNVDVVLSDVRVGDVIEYEYTVHSNEKLFPGHYSARISVGWSDPMLWQRVRARSPATRDLQYRFSGAAVPAQTQRDGAEQELVFTWDNLVGIAGDNDRPRWYRAWPELQLGEYADWPSVAKDAAPLFTIPDQRRPRVDAAAAALAAEPGTPEQKVLKALQMVQDEVRYTSISIGRGSHVPTDPEIILERRFGDCKDKALLLSTLLRKIGIDARPALVHSRLGQGLGDALPTPYAFDHAIARVQLGDKIYWLDGTSAKQYSALDKLVQASFGYALPITTAAHADAVTAVPANGADQAKAADSAGLETMPKPAPQARGREVETILDLSRGTEQPAPLDVVTRYEGDSADAIRRALARKSNAQQQAEYLNYYSRHYPRLQSAGALSVEDDLANDVLVTHERYVVEQPLTKNDDGRLSFNTRTDEMYRYGNSLQSGIRNSPLALDYPEHIQQRYTVTLPADWTVKNEHKQVENPAFRYRSSVEQNGQTVKLSYDYEALADHVETAALAQYKTDRAALYADLDYGFSYRKTVPLPPKEEAPLALAPAPLFIALLSLAFGIWLMRRDVYAYDPPARRAAPGARAGFTGWLGLAPAFSLFLPLFFLYRSAECIRFIDSSLWLALPARVAELYRDQAQAFTLVMLALAGLILPLTVTGVIALFRKRTSAPLLLSISTIAVSLYSGVQLSAQAVSGLLEHPQANERLWLELLVQGAVAVAVCGYLLRSNCVKATFVNRLPSDAGNPEVLETP